MDWNSYFADHGLLCHLLGVRSINDRQQHIYKGNLWENIVFMELVKTQDLRSGVDLFFYRDQNGVEIDFVLERSDGNNQTLYLIEAIASEQMTNKRMNFKKVTPLLQSKLHYKKLKQIVAVNIIEKQPLLINDYVVFNPILSSFPL